MRVTDEMMQDRSAGMPWTELGTKYGVHPDTIRKAMSNPVKATVPATKPIGRPVTEFREKYDKSYIVPKRVRETLKELGAAWLYEVEFAKAAGVSTMDLGLVRDEFADFIVSIGKDGRRVWAGTKATAQTIREAV